MWRNEFRHDLCGHSNLGRDISLAQERYRDLVRGWIVPVHRESVLRGTKLALDFPRRLSPLENRFVKFYLPVFGTSWMRKNTHGENTLFGA